MSFRLAIKRGEWANQVRKLSRAMGQTMEQTLRGQAKLFVRDAIRFTPPFGDEPIKEKFEKQLEIGRDAVFRDRKRVFVEASAMKQLCEGRWGKNITRLIQKGNVALANKLLVEDSGLRVSGIQTSALDMTWRGKRDKRGAVPRGVKPAVLHDGVLPSYKPGLNALRAMPEDPELRRILTDKLNRVGAAKSGWVKAAKALKVALPKWIKGNKGAASGTYQEFGQGSKFGVRVYNEVPHVQLEGRQLRIVERAMANRERNIAKQAEAAWKAAKKKEKL